MQSVGDSAASASHSVFARFAQHLIGPFVLLLITAAVLWKLTLTEQYTWLNNPDGANQILPWFQFQAAEWHAGRFPLWDPHHWAGQSLVGQDQPGVMYPLNWILFLASYTGGYTSLAALSVYFAFIHYMAALYCYWLIRDLGTSRLAAILGGVTFGLGGYMSSTVWPQMLNGAVWVPLVLLFFLRATRVDRPLFNAAVSGALLGVSLLSGHHQVPIFTALMIAGVWIYSLAAKRCSIRTLAGLAAIFPVFAFLVGAAQLLPGYEYWTRSLRWVNAQNPVLWRDTVPYSVHAHFSLNPVSILGTIFPLIHTNADPFVGIVALVLALLAVASLWSRLDTRLFAGIAVGGVVFALGGDSVVHGLLYSVLPFVDKARNPSMAIIIFDLGIGVLAAFGADAVLSRAGNVILARRFAFGLFGLATIIYSLLLGYALMRREQVFELQGVAMTALICLATGGLLLAWHREGLSARAVTSSLALVMVIELGNNQYFLSREDGWSYLDKLGEAGDVAAFLKRQDTTVRVGVDRTDVPYNLGDWYGIDQLNGYAGVTENIFRVGSEPNGRLLLGEGFFIGRKPPSPDAAAVFQGRAGLNVYREPNAFPRAWTVHRVEEVRDSDAAIVAIREHLADLRDEGLVRSRPPALDSCAASDTVRIIDRASDFLRLDADMQCKGMVVISDAYFPGWKATVDGSPAPLYEVDSAIRGVVLDRGAHRLEMRYRPRSVYAGCSLTIAGMVLLVTWAAMKPRGRV